jgi:hypothetical protein
MLGNARFYLMLIALPVLFEPLSANAEVFSQATIDASVYTEDDAFGGDITRVFIVDGLTYSDGLGRRTASVHASSPRFSEPGWDLAGTYAASSVTEPGINKAYASASGSTEVLEGLPKIGAMALSGWSEQITIHGGHGAGALSLTARLDGQISITGSTNSQGLRGVGLAYLHFLTSTLPPSSVLRNGFEQGLAFPCAIQKSQCDYNRDHFQSVGLITTGDSTSSLAFDQTATFSIPFEYNVPFYLYGVLEVNAQAYNPDVTVTANFLNTGRITALVSPPSSIVTLGSGAYSAFALPSPVPEPGALWLALAGLVAVATPRWWRRQGKPI